MNRLRPTITTLWAHGLMPAMRRDQGMKSRARGLFNGYMILAVAVMVHMIFHLRRHTALMDGALRRITPKAIHTDL
jgi:hypothetical protein